MFDTPVDMRNVTQGLNLAEAVSYFGNKVAGCYCYFLGNKVKSGIRENPRGTTPTGRVRKMKTSAPGQPYYAHRTLSGKAVNGAVKGNHFIAKKFFYDWDGDNKAFIAHGIYGKPNAANWSTWVNDIETTGMTVSPKRSFRVISAINKVAPNGLGDNRKNKKGN